MKNIGKLLTIILTLSFVLLTIGFVVFRNHIPKILDVPEFVANDQNAQDTAVMIQPKNTYQNPFSQNTQYKNPFETYQNPFD